MGGCYKDRKVISMSDAESTDNKLHIKKFMDIVVVDLQNIYNLLGRKTQTTFNFWKVPGLDNVYIFQYSEPVKNSISHQFNQISLSNLICHFGLDVREEESPIFTTSDHETHYLLELFCKSKKLVDGYCQSQLQDVSCLSAQQIHDLQALQKCNDELKDPLHSANYTERTWTKRLFHGIESHNPNLKPKLTLDYACGGGFAINILEPWSRCSILATCVPLRGSPDLTIDRKIVTVGVDQEESDLSSDTTSLELSSRSKLMPATGMEFCPEKLGELSAAMYTKAYCQFLKQLKQGNMLNECTVGGLLLNKSENEAIHCKLQMHVHLVHALRRHVITSKTVLHTRIQSLATPTDLCTSLHYNMVL